MDFNGSGAVVKEKCLPKRTGIALDPHGPEVGVARQLFFELLWRHAAIPSRLERTAT
jgi:hypothetical protein